MLTAVCIDAVGQAASTVGQPNPTVVLTGWRADWNASSIPAAPFIVVPESLPQVAAIVIVDGGNVSTASLSCLALLAPASATPPPLSQSLDRVSSRDMLSSVTGAVALANGSAAGIAFSGLTASAARLGQALAVYAECTWVPTGERVRLPTLSLAVANASLALTPATSLLVEAYESASVAATAMLSPAGVATFAGAAAACTWRAGAATTSSLVLAASTVASTWTLDADGAVVGGQPLALTVDGPPSATLTLQLVCSLWGGNTVASPPFNVTTTTYAMALRGGGGAGTLRAVWPSGTQAVLPLAPALDVAAPARGVLTCSVEVTSVVLPPLAATPGVGLGLADTAVQLVGEPSVSVSLASAATHANVSLPRVGLRAPSGTNASLALTCRDGVGRSATLGALLNVSVAALSASWSAGTVSSMPSVVVPSQALPSLTLTLASTPAVPLPPNADVGSLVTCVAALVRASMSLPLGTPLATLLAAAPPYASVSTINMALGADNASIVITLPSLSTVACPLSTPLMVAAECTWTPTGERLRLPSLTTATLPLSASWVSPPTAVLGYSAVPLRMVATLLAPASAGATASAQCDVVLLNATARGVSVLADAWVMGVDASAPAGTTIAANVDVTLQAPPGATVFVQASCEVWGQAFDTPPLRLTAATLALQLLSGVPASFIASDASSPWPLDPPLSLRVVTNDGAVVTDVSCAVATSTPGAEFKVIGSSVSLQSVSAHGATGVVDVPPFVVQTAPTTEAIDATAECRRSSGDAPQPLTFTVPAIKLHTELCNTPQSTSEVGTPLPSFGVGIVTVAANGSVHNPCNAATPTMSLPPIVCTISLNASATTTNDTSSIFLQHTLTTIAAATHRAAFDAFTLVAPQGETYGLSLACAVGGLAIPPALPFTVALAGCRAGQESVSVACVTCGGGAFSLGGMGAQCKECPSVGASCNEGIITLLPHYFRPAAQAGQPLGPDTELHPCYNSEACTLEFSGNASGAVYGCSAGYTGPLCGVCDAAANYARFGDACDVCWDPSGSAAFLAVVIIVVLAVLAHMALFSEVYSSYPDDAIILRIAISYLQGIGSLRVFVAGSTKAYASVMGWTEVVSASPLSVGALQCLLRLSYLMQYAGTVALPLLASAIVIIIFMIGTTARSVRFRAPRAAPSLASATPEDEYTPIRCCCWFDSEALARKLASWWGSKRHISTMLFVLFFAYMPITSASLRALDCIRPVAGIRYLRSNLAVECGVGEHAVARLLAYTVLFVVGIGFPVGLAWLLGTARRAQLVDTAFHATWGFLFDGYRVPTRKPVALEGATGSSAKVAAPFPIVESPLHAGSTPAHHSGTATTQQTWVVTGDNRVWWEGVVLVRKAGVVLLAVLVTNPYLQCVGATLWFFGAILLQLKYTPYTKARFNRLELATLTAIFASAVISTALLQYNVDVTTADLHAPTAMTPIEWAVTVLLVIINMGMFGTLGFMWLRVQWKRARALVRRIHAPPPTPPPPAATKLMPPPPPPPLLPSLIAVGAGDVGSSSSHTDSTERVVLFTHNPMRSGGPPALPARSAGMGTATAQRVEPDNATAPYSSTPVPTPGAKGKPLRRPAPVA